MSEDRPKFLIETDIDISKLKTGFADIEKRAKAAAAKVASVGGGTSSMHEAESRTSKFKTSMSRLVTTIGKTNQPLTVMEKDLVRVSNSMQDVSRRVFVWGSMSAVIFGALQGLHEMLKVTIDINTAMTDLMKVLPRSSDFASLREQSFDIAIKFGGDPVTVVKTLRRFAQAGLDAADALTATKTAMLAMNTTGAEFEAVYNAIIASNRIFNESFEESSIIMDKIQRLQADFAVDSKDLITSITAIGPAITTVNGNIDDLFSTIAAMVEAARVSGKEASNSLKRVFSRIPSKEGIKALQELGVNVMKTTDTYRPLRAILGDLAEALKTATEAEKQRIAITLAQVRQYPKLIAFLGNYQRAVEALEKSEGAFGDAFAANEVVMDSYSKRLEVANAEFKKFSEGIVRGGFMEALINMKTGLGGIAGALGNINPRIISTIATFVAFVGAAKLAKNMVIGFTGANSLALKKLSSLQLMLGRTVRVVNEAGESSVVAASGMRRMALAFSLVTVAATAAYIIYQKATEKSRELKRVTEDTVAELENMGKSLVGVAGSTFSSFNSTSAFTVMDQALKDLFSTSVDMKPTLTEVQHALSKIIFGESGEQMTVRQLETINDMLLKLKKAYTQIVIQPITSKLNDQLSEFKKQSIKTFQDILSHEDDSKEALKLGKLPNLTGRPSEGVVDAAENIEYRRRLRDISSYTKLLETLTDGFELSTMSSDKFSRMLSKTADIMRFNVDTLAKLAVELKNVNEATDPESFENLTSRYQRIAKNTADMVVSLFDADKLISQMQVGGSLTGAFADKDVAKANAYSAIVSEIGTQLRTIVEKKYGEEIGGQFAAWFSGQDLRNTIDDLTDGIAVTEIATVSFLNAIKKSTFGISASFAYEIDMIDEMNRLSKASGLIYDENTKKVRAAEAAIDSMVLAQKRNFESLKQLETEGLVLEEVIAKSGDLKLSNEEVSEVETKLAEIKTKFIVLNSVVEASNAKFGEQYSTLIKIADAYRNVASSSTMYLNTLKYVVDMTEGATSFSDKIADASSINMDISDLEKSEKLHDQILKSKLNELDARASLGKLSKQQYIIEKQSLTVSAELEKLSRLQAYQVAKVSDLYKGFKNDIESIRSVMSEMLSDQEGLVSAIESGNLGGLLSGGITDIYDVVLKRDAELITESLSSGIASLLKKTRDDISDIEDSINNTSFGSDIADSMFQAGNIAAISMGRSIISGSTIGGQVIHDQIVMSIGEIEDALNRFKTGMTDVVSDQNLKDIVDNDSNKLNFTDGSLKANVPSFESDKVDLESKQYEVNQGIAQIPDVIDSSFDKFLDDYYKTQKELIDFNATKTEQLHSSTIRSMGNILGGVLGSFVASGTGKSSSGVNFGTSIGGLIGTLSGNPLVGGMLSVAGGVLGGLFGPGKEKDEQVKYLARIEENTAQMVDRLTAEIINAPSTFTLPASGAMSTGGGIVVTNNITVSGSNATGKVVSELSKQLNDLYYRSSTSSRVVR